MQGTALCLLFVSTLFGLSTLQYTSSPLSQDENEVRPRPPYIHLPIEDEPSNSKHEYFNCSRQLLCKNDTQCSNGLKCNAKKIKVCRGIPFMVVMWQSLSHRPVEEPIDKPTVALTPNEDPEGETQPEVQPSNDENPEEEEAEGDDVNNEELPGDTGDENDDQDEQVGGNEDGDETPNDETADGENVETEPNDETGDGENVDTEPNDEIGDEEEGDETGTESSNDEGQNNEERRRKRQLSRDVSLQICSSNEECGRFQICTEIDLGCCS